MLSTAQMLIGDGLLPLIILGMVMLEAVGLWLLHARFGIGPGLGPMAGSLVSGAFLVLALYVALASSLLAGPAAGIILLCLAASFAAHLADLGQKFRNGKTVVTPHEKGLRTQGSV